MEGAVSLTLISPFDLYDGFQLRRRKLRPKIPTAELATAEDIAQK